MYQFTLTALIPDPRHNGKTLQTKLTFHADTWAKALDFALEMANKLGGDLSNLYLYRSDK